MKACPHCGAEFAERVRFCGKCGAKIEDADDTARLDALIGRIIDGRYKIVAAVGQGGMGTVYRVEHVALGKLAALKMLNPDVSKDEGVLRRFRREAEAVSRLSHPNIVQVFDFGVSQGAMYLVMELLRGEDLGGILDRDGQMPFDRAAPILIQVCEALAHAHEKGIVHRDLKPENLIIGRTRSGNDRVTVLDFGLAKLRDQDDLKELTDRGIVVGTPHYMSPEQIKAESLDFRSDIYSLGALMYRMLCGSPPFTATTSIAVLTKHLTETPPAPSRVVPGLPVAVDEIVAKAMAKRAGDRYESADALRRALQRISGIPSRDTTTPSGGEGRRRHSDVHDTSEVNEPRLRREDVDEYEQKLKRRRTVYAAVPILAVLLALSYGIWFVTRPPRALEVEKENNNSPTLANQLGSGVTIRGQLGRIESTETSDRDVYRMVVVDTPADLEAKITGLPLIDIKLELFDAKGRRFAEADDNEENEEEELIAHNLPPGEYFLSVREVWTSGQRAHQDLEHWYRLTATWRATEHPDAPTGAIRRDRTTLSVAGHDLTITTKDASEMRNHLLQYIEDDVTVRAAPLPRPTTDPVFDDDGTLHIGTWQLDVQNDEIVLRARADEDGKRQFVAHLDQSYKVRALSNEPIRASK